MNIRFSSLSIKGFMSIKDEFIDLQDLGVVTVKGINEHDPLFRSNGSGKSAIFDSILWALTGYTSRGSSNVQNRYLVPQTGARVEVNFSIDEHDYQVVRTEGYEGGGKTLTIIRDDEDISGNTFTKSRDILRDQLSFVNYEVLTSIIILSQGLSGRLSNLKPSSRKSRLEYLSNTDSILEEIQGKINQAHSVITADVQSLNSERVMIETTISANKSTINSCKSKIEEIEKKKSDQGDITESNIKEYKERIFEIEKKSAILMDKYRESNKIASDHANKVNKVDYEMNNYSALIKQAIAEWKSISDNKCPTCERPLDNSEDMRKSSSNKLANLKKQYSSLLETKKVLDSKVIPDSHKYYKAATSSNQELALLRSKVSEYEKSVASTDSYYSTIKECEEIIKNKEAELSEVCSKIKSKEDELNISNYFKSSVSRKFRNFLLEGVVSYLNNRLEHYSEYLFTGDDNLVYLESNGNNIDIRLGDSYFEDLSGGEGRRVDIILQLAQRDLSKSESGFNCNLLVLDEVLDYLDGDGIISVLGMLEQESSFIDTMMIVTHKDDISVPCDSEITVVKGEDRLSRIQ